MQLKRLEDGFAALLFLFGLYITVQAIGYGVFGPTVTGTGFFPLLSGLLLLAATGTLLVRRLRGASGAGAEESGEVIAFRPMLPVAAVVGLTVLFLLLVETLGMILMTPVYVGAVACVIEMPRTVGATIRTAAVAFGFTLFAWLLFSYALRVPLP